MLGPDSFIGCRGWASFAKRVVFEEKILCGPLSPIEGVADSIARESCGDGEMAAARPAW
jgi:hypothetical protein